MREAVIKNFLLGYSGHAYVVIEAALLNGMSIDGYVDKKKVSRNPFNLKYVGDENKPEFEGWTIGAHFLLGIGNNLIRTKVAERIISKGFNIYTIIHPESHVSNHAEMGKGTFVARNAAINPFCEIGDYVIINTSASIDHECRIHSGAHIAPGAVLAGNVEVGQRTFIGANSVIKEGVRIGSDVLIGAGAVVVKDIQSGNIAYGNPARLKTP